MEVMMKKKMSEADSSNKDDEVVLPGFRFHPTDEELVGFYLRRKVEKKSLSIELIKQIDIYKYDPWDLPISTVGDKEWYFFCIRERKYRNSIRPNRVTGSGFWKATGIDKPIYSVAAEEAVNACIGLKKSLVYYRGSAGKGTKTEWMMHEFRLPTSTTKNASHLTQEAEIWTLCRIFKRNVTYKKYVPATNSSIKRNPTDSFSQTCSFESVNEEKYKSFGASIVQQQEKKPISNHFDVEWNNNSVSGHFSSTNQAPSFEALYSSFPNSNGDNDFFVDGNWDELRPILGFASDPALLYGCR